MDSHAGILHHEEGVDLIPSNIELAGLEVMLVNAMSRELTLKNYLNEIKRGYDYVLIDCMPSVNNGHSEHAARPNRATLPLI